MGDEQRAIEAAVRGGDDETYIRTLWAGLVKRFGEQQLYELMAMGRVVIRPSAAIGRLPHRPAGRAHGRGNEGEAAVKVPSWICDHGNGEFDHDWKLVSDWSGDPDVIGGTFDCSFKRCEQCGEEAPLESDDPLLEPPEPYDV